MEAIKEAFMKRAQILQEIPEVCIENCHKGEGF